MAIIPLGESGEFAVVDDEDYHLVADYKWTLMHIRANGKKYAQANAGKVNGKRKVLLMHRVVMGVDDPKVFVDHRDFNGLNNRRTNLREATRKQNDQNKKRYSNNTSGYIGVSAKNGKHVASIRHERKTIYIGYFDCPMVAAKARDRKAFELRGEFANLNFPLDSAVA